MRFWSSLFLSRDDTTTRRRCRGPDLYILFLSEALRNREGEKALPRGKDAASACVAESIGESDDGRRYSRWFSWRLRIYGSTLAATQYVATTGGAAPSPFSLAAYIILPIERHTSFPLYVSIYNGPRNICSSLCAKEWNRTAQLDTRTYPRGLAGWCQRGWTARDRSRNWCTATREQCLVTNDVSYCSTIFSLAASTPDSTTETPIFPKIKDARMSVWQMWYKWKFNSQLNVIN